MKALQQYPQVSTPFLKDKQQVPVTPFLSPKDKQKVEKLPGQGENVGLTEWKSVSTLNTEHSGDPDAIYNHLHKMATAYSK